MTNHEKTDLDPPQLCPYTSLPCPLQSPTLKRLDDRYDQLDHRLKHVTYTNAIVTRAAHEQLQALQQQLDELHTKLLDLRGLYNAHTHISRPMTSTTSLTTSPPIP